jgi:hypothetical protein
MALPGLASRFAPVAEEGWTGEDFRAVRLGRERVSRAGRRAFFFICAEDSESDLEGTIILRARSTLFG